MAGNNVWLGALKDDSVLLQIGLRFGRAVVFNSYVLSVLGVDARVRIVEPKPTGAWIDSLTGTTFASFGDILIWFPGTRAAMTNPNAPGAEGLYLVLAPPTARFLLGDGQVDTIPTPVGKMPTGVKREERGRQLTIE